MWCEDNCSQISIPASIKIIISSLYIHIYTHTRVVLKRNVFPILIRIEYGEVIPFVIMGALGGGGEASLDSFIIILNVEFLERNYFIINNHIFYFS